MLPVCQKTADRRFLRERHPAQKAQGVLHNKKENTDTVKKEVFDVKLSYLSYFYKFAQISFTFIIILCATAIVNFYFQFQENLFVSPNTRDKIRHFQSSFLFVCNALTPVLGCLGRLLVERCLNFSSFRVYLRKFSLPRQKTRPKSRAGDRDNEKFQEPGLRGRYVKSG